MHEWPLIIFTTLIQTSIGCFLLTMFYVVTTKNNNKIYVPIMTSFAISLLGLIASIFHLGNPWHMFNTMNNVLSSWMSREVIFVGSYTGLLALTIAYFLLKKKYHAMLLGITTIVGASTLFVMSNIYVNSLFLLWNGWVTYSAFWSTALIAGGLIACLAFSIALKKENQHLVMQRITTLFFIFAFIAIVLNVCAYVYLHKHITDNATLGITARHVNSELVTTLTLIKYALLLIGLASMALFKRQLNTSISLSTVAITSIIIVMAEVIGRYSFFCLGV
ncbi:dimethyl sulfoxide reductase anchor subunit family protein [Dickeya dianthicola]|uniref:dimethyl sulfoxide reductase anchor subunit family protein n=1 Tax=Dickeya dianthicola TaxID=204039 RepID=UPI0018669926|nr:DmsC/YnfH family molybdoenzyme membrane anchor subunit [Dickeya dianthicola]QOL13429.1 dimethyl sulfoxide reductase anchor subunit [Dickeya dianthicola]